MTAASPPHLATAVRFAGRSLRGTVRRAFRGFGIFVACLALGVAAIAGVAALGRSFDASLAAQGDLVLGGDAAFSVHHRPLGGAEHDFLAARGLTSDVATLRAMARRDDGTAVLVEAKAVDDAYPLVGRLAAVTTVDAAKSEAVDGRPFLAATGEGEARVFGVLVEDTLLPRLGLAIGDRLTVGSARVRVAGIIVDEPDRLSSGLGFGPRLMMSRAALEASGLLAPGSLVRWHTRLLLAEGGDPAATVADAKRTFPAAGWEIRSRHDAAPGLAATIDRFVQFLTLVGLTTLVIGGLGVAHAVTGHLERRRQVIAVWKTLGATRGFVFLVHALEIGAIALLGIALGVGLGAAVPFLFAGPLGSALGLDLVPVLAPGPLALAALEGAVTAALFVALPLGVAVDARPAALLRGEIEVAGRRPRFARLWPALVLAAALIALVVGLSPERRITLPYLATLVVAFLVLRLVAAGLVALARRLPRPHGFEARAAVAAIARPGAPTASIVMSLGLGATLLAALAQVQSGLTGALSSTLPQRAPSFFFLDVPSRDADAFRVFLKEHAGDGVVADVPMLRGRITALKGVPVEKAAVAEESRFVLEGDRGVTFSALPPENAEIVEGAWWKPDHAGPPQVSFDAETAKNLGLAIGDRVTVNVLGRDVEATLTSLRRIEWGRLAINFFMVFSPDAFRGAPATRLVTVTFPDGGEAKRELALLARVVERFPVVSAIRVKDALTRIDDVMRRVSAGVAAVAGFTVIAAVLVLAGALTARQEARIRDTAVLAAIGATRRRLLTAFGLEFALTALAGALFAVAVGTTAAWWVLTRVMKLGFVADPVAVVGVVALTTGLTVALGLLSTRAALRRRPADVLRSS
ncbi:MAG: ABC transporter permease [Siculibacillus sp.]|nr:ABC transporter permease [Siculibacillus sp.]